MSKLSSTSIEQNKEYIKQLKKQRTQQLRKEIKILDEEKAFQENDVTSIKTDEEFKDESEDIYQIYLKMGILKPKEKTEGQKWLDEINNLLKEKIVNTATIDKMTKILYGGSYWDFKYKSFKGYRDAIQKGSIPKADDTVIDAIIKSVMKDLSYLNLTPISPDSRITEINKLFNRSLEIRSFMDRQRAILEKITKSNPEKDQPLRYSGNPNLRFNFNEYSFESNTDVDSITSSQTIYKNKTVLKPTMPNREFSNIINKNFKFSDITLDKPTRAIVQARGQEDGYRIDKNRVIEIEKNFLKDSFLEEITQSKNFMTIEDALKYATLSGREAVHIQDSLNPTTFIDGTTKPKDLSSNRNKDKLIVRKPQNRNLVVPEVLTETKLDKLIVDVSNDDLSYMDESDIRYENDKDRQIPEYKMNINEVVLDDVQPKKQIKQEEKIEYKPDQNRSISLGSNLNKVNNIIEPITPKLDLEHLMSNNNLEYKPKKGRTIKIDRTILNTKIGVDEILEKQENSQNEQQKKMIDDYKRQISARHNKIRADIKNNIFDHNDPIQVSREKEIKSSRKMTKSSGDSNSGDSGGSDGDSGSEVISNSSKAPVNTNIEVDLNTDMGKDIKINTDAEAGVKADVETDVEVDVETDVEADVEADVETDIETDVEADVETDMKAEVETNINVDTEIGIEELKWEDVSPAAKSDTDDSNTDEHHIKEIDISKLNNIDKRSSIMNKFEGIDVDIDLDDFEFDDSPANFKDVGGKILPDSFVEEKELDLDTITEEELMENYEKQREEERRNSEDQIESAIINTNPVKMQTKPETKVENKDLGKRRVKQDEIDIDDLIINETPTKKDTFTETVEKVVEDNPKHTDVTIDELLINEGSENQPIDVVEVGLDQGMTTNKLNPSNMTGTSEEKVQNILGKIFSEVDDELGDLPDLSKLISTTTKSDGDDLSSVDDILSSIGDYNYEEDCPSDEVIDERKDTLVEDIRTKSDVTETVIIEDSRTDKDVITDRVENQEKINENGIKEDLVEDNDTKITNTNDIPKEMDKETFKEDIINEIMGRLNSVNNNSVKVKDALDTLTDLLKEKHDIPEEYRERLTTFAEFLKKDNLLIQDYDSKDEIGESVKAPTLSYEKEDMGLEPITELDSSDLEISGDLDKLISLDLEELNNNIDTKSLSENIVSDLDSINKTTSMASQDTIDFVRIRQAMDNMLKNSWEIELGLRFNFVPSEKVISKLNEYDLEVEQLGNGDCIVFYRKMDIKYLERRPSYHDFMTELKIAVTNLLKTAMKQKVRLVNKNFIPRVTEEEIKIMQNHLTKLKLGIDGKDLVLDINLDN